MKLVAHLIDLLLDCFLLLIGPDDGPAIAVSTIPELAAALLRDNECHDASASGVKLAVANDPGTQSEHIRGTAYFVRSRDWSGMAFGEGESNYQCRAERDTGAYFGRA